LRLAGYRAIARSGIEDLGAGINLNPSTGTGTTDFVFNATTGNPNLKPLRAWNADASLEFYPTRDTLLSIAGYYKWAKGTVIDATVERPTQVDVTTITDGGAPVTQTVTINPVAPTNDSETRHLYGVEVNANTAFTFLPSPLDGFGVQLAANRAFADFEYPDTSAVAGYLDPANLIGLSKWTASGSVYWEKWGVSLRALYRYRSHYFKPNSNTNRSVQGSGYLNLSALYKLTPNVSIKLQALNVTGTRDVFYKAGYDSIAEVSDSGTQYYFGFRVTL
jgi:TonB-dependent receptor